MAKYRVTLNTVASVVTDVEANNEDEAFEAALSDCPSDVCAQCGGWGQEWELNLGEFSGDTDGFTVSGGTAEKVED